MISVITPTVQGREELLAEAVASVSAQTVAPLEHLWLEDTNREGPGLIRNRLAEMARGDWLLFLDDDDLLDADFLETLTPHLTGDVVYGWCRVQGANDWTPNRLYNRAALEQYNFIPVTALVRKQFFAELGGFQNVASEDWDLWRRAARGLGEFVCVPEVVWTYRVREGTRNAWTLAA